MRNYTKAYTHAGVFHADDVFSTALVQILCPGIKVERVIKVPDDLDEETIVYDIGGGMFDHHQAGSPMRPEELAYSNEPIPYAAFGLLWREFGHELVDDTGWANIDESLVYPIDSHDNGVDMTNSLSIIIKHMNPRWDSDETAQECFDNAVAFAKGILEREIAYHNSTANAIEYINKNIVDGDPLLVMDRFVPWVDYAKARGIKVGVYPSQRGGWCIQSVDSALYPLPEEWTNNLPINMSFAHKAHFLASCDTVVDAMMYARQALERMV